MDARATSLEEFLVAVLRGAAKILGCGSTNLILINEKTQEIRVRLGAMAVSNPIIAALEGLLGRSFQGACFPVRLAQGSLIYRAWRDHSVLETSSLAELVGGVMPARLVAQMSRLIGEQRFICVPARSSSRSYGVLLFQKEGPHPFSRQQREVLLRYARRIGEILESDLTGQGQLLVAQLPGGGPDYLLLDGEGQLLGHGPSGSPTLARLLGSAPTLAAIAARVRALASGGPGPLLASRSGELSLAELGEPSPAELGEPSLAELGEPSLAGEAESAAASLDLRVQLLPFQVGGLSAVLCEVRRERRAEASLESQLLQLTLGEPAPAVFVDPELRITSCNEATEQLLGWSPGELLHSPVGRLFSEPDEIEALLRRQVLDPTAPPSGEASVLLCKDGRALHARVEALLLAGEDERAVGFLVLLREGDSVEARTDERLVRQERLATMGEMAAQLAHEMRNPLVAIGATLESLGRDPALPEEQRQVVGSLAAEIVRLDLTLKGYLAARDQPSFGEVELGRLVEDASRLLESAARRADKRILLAVPEGLRLQGDHDALRHLLFNLLLNALEASPAGAEVRCSAGASAHQVTVTVEDRGCGLQTSAAECFQPFFTTKQNGTGLGLAVCRKIARAHGGVVDLRNRPEGGCRATLTLPRRATASAEVSG